jgi:hypothetical protein
MSEEDNGFPPDIMNQLFPDRHTVHPCADKLNKGRAAGFNYFPSEEIEAQREAFDEFLKSLDSLYAAISRLAKGIVEWAETYHDEIELLRKRIEENKAKEVSK